MANSAKDNKLLVSVFQALYCISFEDNANAEKLKEVFFKQHDFRDSDTEVKEICDASFQLACGILQNEKNLDKIISGFMQNWKLAKLNRTEHILLRIGVYGIFNFQKPAKKTISDICNLSRQFNMHSAIKLISGVLTACDKSGRTNLLI